VFTDWCTVTDVDPLPAEPDRVIAFLADCPCAPATRRRRVAAIDHHHAAAGLTRPGESAAVRTLLGRPTCNTFEASPDTIAAVEAALRGLPSQGWTRGMFGRRDRCLLVLSQLAGVPYKHLATMTAGDVVFADGVATITAAAGRWSVRPAGDAVLCGPCAVARWLRVLDLAVTKVSTSVLKKAVGKAGLLTDQSPHLCRSNKKLNEASTTAPLFPPINQWGALPFPLESMTPHSLSQRVRDILAGDLGAHRDLPVDQDDDNPQEQPAPTTVVERSVYSREDSLRAWARRRADLEHLSNIADELAEVDRRVDELNQQVAATVSGVVDVDN
jgi:hypothetical protein